MPRFTAIEITHFRGLQNVRLEGLGMANLLVGKNNAGKSTVLEAVSACCHPINAVEWLALARRRGLGSPRQSYADLFSWFWPRSSGKETSDLELRYERTGTPKRWCIHGHQLQQKLVAEPDSQRALTDSPTETVRRFALHLEPTDAPPDGPSRQSTSFTLRTHDPVPENRTAADVPAIMVSPITHRAELFQIVGLSRLEQPDVHERIVRLVQRLDPDIQNIEVYDPTGEKSSLRVWHRRMGSAPINVFGEGLRRALAYGLSLAQAQGGVLLIDEIETAIHYSALRDVYRWLIEAARDLDVQLFMTTHSLEAIDAMLEASPDHDDTAFYRLYDVGEGTQVLRLAEPELRMLREQFGDEVRG